MSQKEHLRNRLQASNIEFNFMNLPFAKICITKNYGNYLAYLFVFVVMLILNIKTPLVADDYSFSLVSVSSGERITSISQIYDSLVHLYFNWTGRVILFSLTEFFLMYDKIFFSIFNYTQDLSILLKYNTFLQSVICSLNLRNIKWLKKAICAH